MNYKYKIDDTEIILAPEEHEAVKKAFEAGKSPVFLRNGSLAINKSFVRYVQETEHLTGAEEKKKREYLALPLEKRQSGIPLLKGFSKSNLGGMERIFDPSSHKECSECKQIHFIPENQERCFSCKSRH